MASTEVWTPTVLLMGARERNKMIKQLKLSNEKIADLKTATRRFKQTTAQQRYREKSAGSKAAAASLPENPGAYMVRSNQLLMTTISPVSQPATAAEIQSLGGKPPAPQHPPPMDEEPGYMREYKFIGPVPSSFHDLTEEQVATISYRDLNKLMTRSGLSAQQVNEAKQLRRKVKNRLSARICNGRRNVTRDQAASTEASLGLQIEHLTKANNTAMVMVNQLREQLAQSARDKLYFEAEAQRLWALLSQYPRV